MELLKIKDYKGIFYVKDDQVSVDKDGYAIPPKRFKKPYKLFFRVTKQIQGKRLNRKRTLAFEPSTSLNVAAMAALEKMIELKKKIGTDEDRRAIDKERKKPITLNQAFDRYMLTKTDIKQSTKRDYINFYDVHVRSQIGYKYLDEIDVYDLQTIVDNIRLEGLSERTALKTKQVLSPVFKYYKKLHIVKENPAELLSFKKLNNEVEITLTDDEKKRLFKAIKNYPIEPFRGVFMFLSTGRRVQEVLSLKWSDLNIEEGYYIVRKENSKVSKEQIYPLTIELLEALPGERDSKWVFHAINDKTKPLNIGTLRRHWNNLLKMAKIKRLRMHDLRHILGNTLVSQGYTLEDIKALLGHTDIKTTQRYAKAEIESKRKALEAYKKMFE